jgi:NAD(P)-dependent dehydrogenase (short-subunit alcohol dehydrogenase family)
MGRSIVKSALSHGDSVCAVGQLYADALPVASTFVPASHPQPPSTQFLGQLCDVRVRTTIAATLTTTLTHFNRIDIIAICTGYGVIGSCEDQDEFLIRSQFEVNFMGVLNILQLSLPYYRTRTDGKGGRYLVFSSTSGALGVPGLGPYCATKYAVEGLIESMLYEVEAFGVRCTLVEPGHLRRDDIALASATSATTTIPPANTTSKPPAELPLYAHFRILRPSPPYSSPDSPSKHAQRLLQWLGNKQPTSGAKAAELVWQLGHCAYPPLRLLLGTYAVESVRDRLKSVIEEIEDWRWVSFPREEDEEEDKSSGDDGDDEEGDGDGEGVASDEEEVEGGEGRQRMIKKTDQQVKREDVEMGGNG